MRGARESTLRDMVTLFAGFTALTSYFIKKSQAVNPASENPVIP